MAVIGTLIETNGIIFGQLEDAVPDGNTPWEFALDAQDRPGGAVFWSGLAQGNGQTEESLPSEAVLSFSFETASSELYLFSLMSRSDGISIDTSNDAWIRVLDEAGTAVAPTLFDFRAANETGVRELTDLSVLPPDYPPTSFFKTYNTSRFYDLNALTIDDTPKEFGWDLLAGETYTLEIGARNSFFIMDYWALWRSSVTNIEVASTDPVSVFKDVTPIPLPASFSLLALVLVLGVMLSLRTTSRS